MSKICILKKRKKYLEISCKIRFTQMLLMIPYRLNDTFLILHLKLDYDITSNVKLIMQKIETFDSRARLRNIQT